VLNSGRRHTWILAPGAGSTTAACRQPQLLAQGVLQGYSNVGGRLALVSRCPELSRMWLPVGI
jgi:hypothetical protein